MLGLLLGNYRQSVTDWGQSGIQYAFNTIYSEISILLSLDFIDHLGFIECPLKPTINKRSRSY